MLDQFEQNYYFVQHANISEEEVKRSEKEEIIRLMINSKGEQKVDRLNRWIDSVDH